MKKIFVSLFFLILLSGQGFAGLVNPGFEDGLNGWDTFKAYSNTTVSTYYTTYDAAGDGNFSNVSWIFYAGYGQAGISQAITTEAGNLSVGLDLAIHFQGVQSYSSPVILYIDGIEVDRVDVSYFWNDMVKRYAMSGATDVDAGSHVLTLAVDNPGSPQYFSHFSDHWETVLSPSLVPVPGAGVLLCSGVAFLVGLRRRFDT